MNISISKHANERMKERLPGMKSAARRYETACKAFFCGARQDSCRGAEAAYLASCIKQEPEYFCRDLLLYMDRIFVFEGNTLVTVLPCDEKFGRRLQKNRAKSHRRAA